MEFLVKSMFPGARLLTKSEAPGILASVETIAKRAGTTVPPVYLFPTRQFNAAIYPAGRAMVIFDGAIKGTGSTLRGTPTAALDGIIAHEMGHWTNALKHFGPMFGLIVGSSLIATGAVYMYDCAQKTQTTAKANGRDIDLQTAFNETAEDMKKKSFWDNYKNFHNYNQTPIFSILGSSESQPQSWGEYFKRQISSVAANALALTAALPLTRPFALANEYEADAFAVKMAKDPQGYIRWMESFQKDAERGALKMGKRVGNVSAGEHVAETMGRWFKAILRETVMAHPDWKDRIAAAKKVLEASSLIHR